MNAPTKHEDIAPSAKLLLESFERVHELVPSVVEGLDSEDLSWRPDTDANPIGWLLWHLARIEDSHLADLNGSEELWSRDGWAQRFRLPYDESAIGFGQDSAAVGKFFVEDPTLLVSYHDAVHLRTKEIVSQLTGEDNERIIDDSYDPPVTVGSRLVSVVNDITQHVGQASYARGLLEGRDR